ncbi:hypothetical protein [Halomonas cupida]|uniref:hypothetical protein n=1 Tax=Halomonas cupida TaxID=44933 RepID=UPI003A917461
MKIERRMPRPCHYEQIETPPYNPEWRHKTPTELTRAERLLACLERQGIFPDEEACQEIQRAYDILHQPLDVDEGPDDDPDPGERAAA